MARHYINGQVEVSDYQIAREEWNAIDDRPEPPDLDEIEDDHICKCGDVLDWQDFYWECPNCLKQFDPQFREIEIHWK